jgi:hypothetical protein
MATTKYKQKVKFATTNVVQGLIDDEWSHSVVQCRSWLHGWDPLTGITSPTTAAEVQECRRCGAVRHRILDAKTGARITGWRPSLPKGYAMPKGAGRVAGHTLDMVRLAALRSVKPIKVKDNAAMYAQLQKIVRGGE